MTAGPGPLPAGRQGRCPSVHTGHKGRRRIAVRPPGCECNRARAASRGGRPLLQGDFGMARPSDSEARRVWPGAALLGILCLLAPAGLAAPALFVFVLLVLAIMGAPG